MVGVLPRQFGLRVVAGACVCNMRRTKLKCNGACKSTELCPPICACRCWRTETIGGAQCWVCHGAGRRADLSCLFYRLSIKKFQWTRTGTPGHIWTRSGTIWTSLRERPIKRKPTSRDVSSIFLFTHITTSRRWDSRSADWLVLMANWVSAVHRDLMPACRGTL